MNHLREMIDTWQIAASGLVSNYDESKEFFRELGSRAMCFYGGDIDTVLKYSVIPEFCNRFPYNTCWFEFTAGSEDERPSFPVGTLVTSVQNDVSEFHFFSKQDGEWRWISTMKGVKQDALLKSTWSIFPEKPHPLIAVLTKYMLLAIMRFLSAMNCTNVKRTEHKPDDALQKARAKRGKLPLFSYWTLELTGTINERGEHQGGTHSSPRVHLRRGHPRQYAPGKYTWVQACAVGNKSLGMVHKDYRLKSC